MQNKLLGSFLFVVGVLLWLFIIGIAFPARAASDTVYNCKSTDFYHNNCWPIEKNSGWYVFEGKLLFEDPLAYKRSPESGVTLQSSKYLRQEIQYLETSIGKSLSLVTAKFNDHMAAQFSLSVATWVTLGYKEGAFPLLTQDFLISPSLSFKYKDFSVAVKYNHISAHLGDGMEALLEDSLGMSEQDAEVLADPFAYSREYISLHTDYRWNNGIIKRRVYIQGGYAWKVIPEHLKKYFVGIGIEVIVPELGWVDPYVAIDWTYNADMDMGDFTGQVGIFLLTEDDDWFTMRIAFVGHHGSDRRGQMLGRKLRQIGFGLFFR